MIIYGIKVISLLSKTKKIYFSWKFLFWNISNIDISAIGIVKLNINSLWFEVDFKEGKEILEIFIFIYNTEYLTMFCFDT